MKSFIISNRPKWCAKILNGEKTIEIRKTAPKDWVNYLLGKTKKKPEPMTGYMYCTEPHAEEVLSLFVADVRPYYGGRVVEFIERESVDNPGMRWSICNGRIPAKFTLMEVKTIHDSTEGTRDLNPNVPHPNWRHYYRMGLVSEKLLNGGDENTFSEEYGELLRRDSCLSQQQIFDYLNKDKNVLYGAKGYAWFISDLEIFDEPKKLSDFGLKRAPQSWCYVEERK